MSEAIVRENSNNDLDDLVNDVHKHFKGRIKRIEDRFNNIQKNLLNAYQGDTNKVKDFSKAKRIGKGAVAAAAKAAANVELMASQEDALTGNNLEGLGLADRIKKGASSIDKVTKEEGNKLVDIAAKMKDEFSHKLDILEKRINTLDKGINSHEEAVNKDKANQSKEQSKAIPTNDQSKAYELINEMYKDLTKRFDSLEKKLDNIERGIEKRIPSIKLENSSEIKKSIIGKAVDGIKGLFRGSEKFKANLNEVNTDDKPVLSSKDYSHNDNMFPDDLDDLTYDLMEGIVGEENMTFERDMNTEHRSSNKELMDMEDKETHRLDGEEPKPFKTSHDNFKFGKFDANVIFKEIENRSDDEFKEHFYSKYNDADKADNEYKIQSRRIEKLKGKGYLEKENGKYRITEKGKEAASKVNKIFEFTSYDANIVFGYINKNNGQLSLEVLKEGLDKEYKTKDEIDKQFSYLQKRIGNNEKAGYLTKNTVGHYVITDKGKEAAAKIELKKNKKNNLTL